MRRCLGFALCLAICSAFWCSPRAGLVRAQVPQEPELVVTMFSSVVVYRTLPTTVILAELADAAGPKASGEGIADASGRALVQFLPLPGARDRYVRPGDRISLARIGARTVVIEVPDLTADVDTAGNRIVGTAPAGATVHVEAVTGPGATVDRTVVADAGGTWQLAEGLNRNGVSGTATYDDPSGRRFVAEFASLAADVTLDATTVAGRGTPGTQVTLAVRRADGSQFQVAAEVVDGTSWSTRLPTGGVVAGDGVTLARRGGPAGPSEPVQADSIPDISVVLDPARDIVSGTGPAGATIVIEAVSLTAESVTREVASAAEGAGAGSFSLDLAGTADLGPGWRVRAAWPAAPELRIGRVAVIAQALIGVHTSAVRGLAGPGAPVTATLRSAAGEQRASASATADDDGTFDMRLGGFMPGVAVTIEAGDVLEVAFVAGDPLVVQVPELVARADADGERVFGRTQAGAEVQVRVLSDPTAPVLAVTADARGDFAADFSGRYDLRRPVSGTATVIVSGGAVFYTSWAAVQLTAQLGNSVVTGYGPPGRAYTARLIAAEGTVLATTTGTTYDFPDLADIVIVSALQGYFALQFVDTTGAAIDLRAGDVLDIVAGDETVALTLPPLEGAVFVEDDILAGRTTPDTAVRVAVESLTGARADAEAVSDHAGSFTHDFSGTHDVQYNDSVQLTVMPDGHVVTAYVAVPGLVLDMDEWVLAGNVAPNKPMVVTARRGADVLGEARSRSDADGEFRAWLRDAAGEALALETGDRLEARVDEPGGNAVSMNVPELVVQADNATDVLSGRATPGGALILLVLRQVLDVTGFGIGQAWPVIDPDGSWSAVPIPTHDVRPGTTVIAQYRLPSGHMALLTHVVPLLAVEHGAPNLCGHAEPRGVVSGALADASGARLATASATTSGMGDYEMVLRDGGGLPVPSAVSLTVSADLAGAPASVDLPEFDIVPDWANQTMSGVGPANTLMLGIFPATRCPSILTGEDALLGVTYAFADATGAFSGAPLPVVEPGQGVQLAFQTPDGHVVFRQAYRSQGRVFLGTNRVAGQTDSLAEVRLTLQAADGSERATVVGQAGPLGDFDLRMPDDGEQPTVIEAGNRIVLEAAGDRADIEVEALSFDWSPGAEVVGQAPTGRPVSILLRLADGRVPTVQRTSDAGGTFVFGVAEVPPRADWALDDVVAVRVVLPTVAGHQIVAQTAGFEAPVSRTTSVYLPQVLRGFSRAQAVQAPVAPSPGPFSGTGAGTSALGYSLVPSRRAGTGQADGALIGGLPGGSRGWQLRQLDHVVAAAAAIAGEVAGGSR